MCLRPCPKEYITALQVSIAKVSCERLLLSKYVSPCEKSLLIAPIILTESLIHGQLFKISSITQSVFVTYITASVVVKVEMSSTFLDVSIKSKNLQPQVFNDKIRTCNESQRELAIVLKSPFNLDLQYRLRQGWKMSRMVTVIITVGRNN